MNELRVNGNVMRVEAPADTPLLWVLRADLGMTGTKFGCGLALCGACTVHLDGQAARSCVTPLAAVGNAEVTTIEGLDSREGQALRAAWQELDVVQCGYCQGGQIMGASALLRQNPEPDDDAIEAAMNGHICRCGTYPRIRAAIHLAARKLRG